MRLEVKDGQAIDEIEGNQDDNKDDEKNIEEESKSETDNQSNSIKIIS